VKKASKQISKEAALASLCIIFHKECMSGSGKRSTPIVYGKLITIFHRALELPRMSY
jgi:hypothetical protein